jgi:hypothetical protein
MDRNFDGKGSTFLHLFFSPSQLGGGIRIPLRIFSQNNSNIKHVEVSGTKESNQPWNTGRKTSRSNTTPIRSI